MRSSGTRYCMRSTGFARLLRRVSATLARPILPADPGDLAAPVRPRARARDAAPLVRAAVITLENVSKAYPMTSGHKVVLQNATATFASGHNYGVLGANGAGKSTLIRLLAGSEMPDRGCIHRDARVSFPLGFGGTFHGALSGRENAAFIARVYGAGVKPTIRFVEDFAELDE